jgi:hypothetical protein
VTDDDIEKVLSCHQKLLDLEQRFKVLEREHEDLHASYRRLRGARAVEARDAPRSSAPAPENDSQAPAPRFSKEELRRKYLAPGRKGDGELS